MEKICRTLCHWRGAFFNSKGNLESLPQSPSPEPSKNPADVGEPRNPYSEPLLDLIAMKVTGTWKDLPQEIVEHIVFMLGDDLKSLKACALTSKALFVSTRHIIHRRICLTSEQNWELLTLREKQRYIRDDRQGIAIKVLSAISAHGLLPYGRQLFINLEKNFTPANLQPFNDHFQRFDRIQELSIYCLHTQGFLAQFDTFFANFVPTLRSLHLDTPIGDARDILAFICRFPNLDDLTFRMSSETFHGRRIWKSAPLSVVKNLPPKFRGRLKLGGISEWHTHILRQLMSLPGKRRFRFIDFRSCPSEVEQPIINACSGTIETLSTTWERFYEKGLPLNLANVTNLYSLTLRVDFGAIRYPLEVLYQTLHTITSPFFSEFVLEVECIIGTLGPASRAWTWWGWWTELDKMFEKLDAERGFRVVIRAEKVDGDLNFIAQAMDRLPLINARGRLVFEIGPFPEK